jgi:hypothetical protein
MKYAFILLLAICANASALDLLVGQYTYHFHDQEKRGREAFKSEHPLIGISTNKYTFIAMENSYNRFSIAVLRTAKLDMNRYMSAALSGGIATNYQDSPIDFKYEGVIPVAYASLDIHPKNDKYGLTITFAPDEFVGAGLRCNF